MAFALISAFGVTRGATMANKTQHHKSDRAGGMARGTGRGEGPPDRPEEGGGERRDKAKGAAATGGVMWGAERWGAERAA